eukprot:688718-Amphidinium_carterae.3
MHTCALRKWSGSIRRRGASLAHLDPPINSHSLLMSDPGNGHSPKPSLRTNGGAGRLRTMFGRCVTASEALSILAKFPRQAKGRIFIT